MVNSSSIGCEGNENRQASCVQVNRAHTEAQSSSPITATSATQPRTDFLRTLDMLPRKSDAVEPVPSKTDFDANINAAYNSNIPTEEQKVEGHENRKRFFCSLPLDKVQTILSENSSQKNSSSNSSSVKITRKVLCLYCDRTFVNVNLRQKHIERCHSSKQLRRVSLRKHQNCFTSTPCIYCDKYTSSTHTLKELFEHLVVNHSNKYFGCLLCENRYFNFSHLTHHNALCHGGQVTEPTKNGSSTTEQNSTSAEDISSVKIRSREAKTETKLSAPISTKCAEEPENVEEKKTPFKNLRSRKMTVKSSKMIIKRSKRLQTKINEPYKKRRIKEIDKKNKTNKQEQTVNIKLNERSTRTNQNSINPYPEFDNFFQVKKITDHSIDNLKISSLTFDDVFDKAFFNRIKCNIQENLLNHIDGKLFKNEASETRISNFEKIPPVSQEVQSLNSENYGCELSLNAITPTTSLLSSSQFGEDLESQIEYGSKASKKKTQIKQQDGHYKYFTRRKYQASILEHKENRDLSKLDIWTQYVIKNRQQKIFDNKKSPEEILDYFSGEEYKNKMKREELNRILDRRGPFEDLREEANKKAALDKLNGESSYLTSDYTSIEVGELLNDILDKVFELSAETPCDNSSKVSVSCEENRATEIPSYLNLRPSSNSLHDNEIDKSDRITLICSSQETENFEHPNNTVRNRNEKVELTGEWARSRIYVCAACGIKLQNLKQFLEHRSASHQYVWVQHYEFVGNQSELYQHLSIPVLGKVGMLEGHTQCKVWKRSDARLCTKCGKRCNSLGELHRHILECGGDWTWMLARKKCKYRPFGTKSRRKRRGLVKRIYTQKTEPSEKKSYKKNFDIPRQKPSDADTIQRMLANLPPKRITRKIICLKDGFKTTRNQPKKTKQSKFKCGKLIHGKGKEQNKNNISKYKRTNEKKKENYRRSLRCLNKVLTSRILDTNSSLIVRRKYKKNITNHKKDNVGVNKKNNFYSKTFKEELTQVSKKTAKNNFNTIYSNNENHAKEEKKSKRSSPRIEKRSEYNAAHKNLMDKMNIKRFFPVKKKSKNGQTKVSEETKSSTNSKSTRSGYSSSKEKQQCEEDRYCAVKSLYLRKRKQKSESNEGVDVEETKSTKEHLKKEDAPMSETSKTDSEANTAPENLPSLKSVELDITESSNIKDPEITPKNADAELNTVHSSEVKAETESKILSTIDQTSEATSSVRYNLELRKLKRNEKLTTVLNNDSNPLPVQNKKTNKRPSKGLNDCIAMLTSKLGKMLDDSSTKNGLPVQVCQETNSKSLKSEYILKVPLFHEHFHLYSKEQNEVLDILSYTEGTPKSEKNVNEPFTNSTEISKTDVDLPDCNTQNADVVSVIENELSIKPDDKNEKHVLRKAAIENFENKDSSLCNSYKGGPMELKQPNNSILKTDTKKLKRKRIHQNLDDKHVALKKKKRKTTRIQTSNNSTERCNISTDIPLFKGKSSVFDEQPGVTKDECSNNENKSSEQLNLCKDESLKKVDRKSLDSDSEDEVPLSVFLKTPRPEPSKNDSLNCSDIISEDNVHEKITDNQVDTHINTTDLKQNSSSNTGELFEHEVLLVKSKSQSIADSIHIELIQELPSNTENKENNYSDVNIAVENTQVLIETCHVKSDSNVENGFDCEQKNNSLQCNEDKVICIEKKNDFEVQFHSSSKIEDVKLALAEKHNILHNTDKPNGVLLTLNSKKTQSRLILDENNVIQSDDIMSVDIFDQKHEIQEISTEHVVEIIDVNKEEEDSLQENLQTLCNDDKPVNGEDNSDEKQDKSESNVERDLCVPDNAILDEDVLQPPVCKDENLKEMTTKSEDEAKICDELLNEVVSTSLFVDEKNLVNKEKLLENEKVTQDSDNNMFNDESKDKSEKDFDEGVKELRRSKRNSKRITSYNEIDLVDPLLDDIEGSLSEIIENASKNIYISKPKNRKMNCKKNKTDSKISKLSGDDLFDLLKETSKENVLSKPSNSIFHNFDDISNEFNDDNFDVLGDLLEKSIAVIEKDLTEKTVVDASSNLSRITEESSNELTPNSKANTENKKQRVSSAGRGKKKNRKHSTNKYQEKLLGKEIESKLRISDNYEEVDVSLTFLEKNDAENSSTLFSKPDENEFDKKCESDKSNYCEICNKFFCRVEGLIKHKRTLTHISKLSEIEAREAALKSKQDSLEEKIKLKDVTKITYDSEKDLTLLSMLKTVEASERNLHSLSYTEAADNSEIKLTDIINDVLNKPVVKDNYTRSTFSNILTQNDNESLSSNKRYRSLAERKSFESESCTDVIIDDANAKTVKSFESEISNTAGTILERQISLLENIIENRSSVSYVDELSTSCTLNECTSADDEVMKYSTQNTHTKENDLKITAKEDFVRPSHYEEISEDSSHRNYDEQKSRKILNRDEELFLECCSLLKSSSEISSYSKTSVPLNRDFSNIMNKKRFNEIKLFHKGYLPRKENSSDSDNSRVTTLLSDNFSPEESNSVTISSSWDAKRFNTPVENTAYQNQHEGKNFTFEKMFDNAHSSEERDHGLNTKDATVQQNNSEILARSMNDDEEKSIDEFSSSYVDSRKILTKGAMKEFEGLRVSIPTEELNMAKILTCSPPVKISWSGSDNLMKRDDNQVKNSTMETKCSVKMKKKCSKQSATKKLSNVSKNSKIHDIYDFEETQDNTDVFPKPNFRSFRSNSEKSRKIENFDDSDNESLDTMNFDAFSSSTSSVSEMVPKKTKNQQNITKKKCMIMGRIFKNAAKSRSVDENIRNIPVMDNTKLVENFVLSCPEPMSDNIEGRTEEELNPAFDNLLNDGYTGAKDVSSEISLNEKNGTKNNCNRKKSKNKNKKRSHWHSDSSDDEFKLQTSGSKRVKKNNSTNNCINLEQELKECIGVASRKSQRKCTSGKQNVLMEYWSSDESLFEQVQNNYNVKNEISELKESRKSEVTSEKVNSFCNNNKEVNVTIESKKSGSNSSCTSNRRKRAAVNPLYHWSSSSEDESHDLIEIKPVRDEIDDDDDERPVQHGWIVGDSPKKLVTMLAQAKGKKCEAEAVKEHGKKRTNALS